MRRGAELRPVQPDPTEDDRQLARDSNLRLPCADALSAGSPLSQRVVSPEGPDDSVCRLEQQAAHHAVAGD